MGIFDFNPHFHKGSDSSEYLQQYIDRYFNPHFHKGSDAAPHSLYSSEHDFNPHFHKGSDFFKCLFGGGLFISIHTSTREVTDGTATSDALHFDFNPHFHKGSDGIVSGVNVITEFISIHTSTREVT